MLEIKNLNVTIQGKKILRELNLTAVSGKITAIVGKSGSGKSTLFKMILGVEELISSYAKEGEILWKGSSIDTFKKRPIQPVFQDPFAYFSPFHSISKCLLESFYIQNGFFHSKMLRDRELSRIESYLPRFHLDKSVFDKKKTQLSGGQLQRLAILRAILCEPELILLDEPVTALDVLVQAEIIELIQELNREKNIGFVLISHDLGLVKNLSHFIYILNEGTIVESGDTKEVFAEPKSQFTKNLILKRDLSSL